MLIVTIDDIGEINPHVLTCDGFDEAIIGMCESLNKSWKMHQEISGLMLMKLLDMV